MLVDESQIKWQQFISGDDDSFSWIYTTYARKLYRYGLCFTSNEEVVRDSIQDIFVYLYDNKTKLEFCDNIKYYLFGAFKNNLIKAIHKESVSEDLVGDMPFLIELTVEDQYIQNEQYVTESKKIEKLLSQKRDVSLHIVVLCARLSAPDFGQDLLLGDDGAGTEQEQPQYFELLISQMDRLTSAVEGVLG